MDRFMFYRQQSQHQNIMQHVPTSGHEISLRYNRQTGIVHQPKIESLSILLAGKGLALYYTLADLALLGAGILHGGVYLLLSGEERRVTQEDVEGQFLLTSDDIGAPYSRALVNALAKLNPDFRLLCLTPPQAMKRSYDIVCFINMLSKDLQNESGLATLFDNYKKLFLTIGSMSFAITDSPLEGIIFEKDGETAADNRGKVEDKKCEEYKGEMNTINALTPSLSSAGAAVLCQEILRRTRCLRHSEIERTWLSVNFLIRSKGIAKKIEESYRTPVERLSSSPSSTPTFRPSSLPLSDPEHISGHNNTMPAKFPLSFRLSIGNEVLDTFPSRRVSDDEYIFRCIIPPDSLFSRIISDSIEVVDSETLPEEMPSVPLLFSPLSKPVLDSNFLKEPYSIAQRIPQKLEGGTVFLVGLGGLGSWFALNLVLASGKTKLIVIDHDDRIEEHNLNRQILYDISCIGIGKAEAAARKLKEINPEADIVHFARAITAGFAVCARDKALMTLE
ncbi:MAG: ThiF family adenylyltransferase, partial [Thermoplasmata archaeon]